MQGLVEVGTREPGIMRNVVGRLSRTDRLLMRATSRAGRKLLNHVVRCVVLRNSEHCREQLPATDMADVFLTADSLKLELGDYDPAFIDQLLASSSGLLAKLSSLEINQYSQYGLPRDEVHSNASHTLQKILSRYVQPLLKATAARAYCKGCLRHPSPAHRNVGRVRLACSLICTRPAVAMEQPRGPATGCGHLHAASLP
jgi:hypothetical protein